MEGGREGKKDQWKPCLSRRDESGQRIAERRVMNTIWGAGAGRFAMGTMEA